MPKKVLRSKKGKLLKPVYEDSGKPWTDECQFNVYKDVEADKRVKPKDVFQNYKDPNKKNKKKKK